MCGDGGQLIGTRVEDGGDEALYIVAVFGEVGGQPIEQFGTPRLAVHLIGVLDDAAADQALPDAVDQRARQAAVARVGEDGGGSRAAVGRSSEARRAIQFGKEEAGFGELVLRHIAAVELQLLFRRRSKWPARKRPLASTY